MDSQNYQVSRGTPPSNYKPMYNLSSMSKRKDGRFQAAKRVNGKIIFGYSHLSQEDADADLQRKIQDLKSIHLSAESTLHDVAMNVWYPRVQNLSKNTVRRYESSYVMYIRERLGRKPIGQIKMQDVQAFVNEIGKLQVSRSGKGKELHKIEPASVRFVYSVLAQIFHCAEWSDIIVKSPCNPLVTLPEVKPKEPETYTVEEGIDLIENAPERLKLPLFLAIGLGLRLGEVCGLEWDDMDRNALTLRVCRQIDGDGNVSEPKTKKSKRVIPITKHIVSYIDAHGDIEQVRMIGMTRRTLEREWTKYLPKGKTFHGLRAGNAGLIVYLTGSTKTASDLLGHGSTAMTEKHYLGRRNHAIGDAVKSLTNALTNNNETN